jgi:hypothetical protein
MTTETQYWLQKKPFNSWQHITWYATLEEAKANFDKVSESSGYSWRLIKAEVLEERLLEGERPEMKQEGEPISSPVQAVKSSWGGQGASGWEKPTVNGGWSDVNGGWATNDFAANILKSEHGMVGKVWLGNPATKEKKRVGPELVSAMMADGWIKAGPRTVL